MGKEKELERNVKEEVTEVTPAPITINEESGTVSARVLHEALGIESNFTTWFSRMVDYGFDENEYEKCFPNLESGANGGQNMVDYNISIDMAKEICMIQRSEIGTKIRRYFISIEKRHVSNMKVLSPQMQIILSMADQMAQAEIKQLQMQEHLKKVDTSLENIREAVRPVFDNWRDEINKKFNRIQKNCNTDFRFLRAEMYNELDRRAGADIHTRLRNMKDRMTEQGSTKTAVSNLNLMDVIEDDKKLREIFSKIVSEYEIKYCA